MSKASIPRVKFDVSRITEAVKADLKKNITALEEIDKKHFDQIYDAALESNGDRAPSEQQSHCTHG